MNIDYISNHGIIKPIYKLWSEHTSCFMNVAKNIEPGFKIDNSNKRALQLMMMYFTGDNSFLTEYKNDIGLDGSFSKGLMLTGGVGTGKSLLFKIFKAFTRDCLRANSFQYYDSMEVIDNVNVYGIDYLDRFNLNGVGKFTNPITCYIDDIGSMNENVKHYGTDHNVIEQLLSIRYIILNKFNKLTHISTNKTPKALKDLYDIRIIDRMREMFNIIELSGESKRK